MNKNIIKIQTKKDIISLSDKEYKAAGGQGVVYCKNGIAYKIYHNPKNMIPVAKIQELSTLKRDNILGPIEPLFDPKDSTAIGFSMPYMDFTEFLCKIFTRNFCDEKKISFQDKVDIVVDMQKTLEFIHQNGFLVVDYNEMNFLLGPDMKVVYHIDVDNWKTPSFPAMALMESVRDRKGPKGVFNEMTDWFSFAVVTFQIYIGIHPYKGFHPKFKPAEWSKRMDAGISVFDKDVALPKSCQDFSVIPKKHLEWYKAIFAKGERSIPPYPDSVVISAVTGKTISSQGGFSVDLTREFSTAIQKIYFFDSRFVITDEGIYQDDVLKMTFNKPIGRTPFELIPVLGEDPLICYLSSGYARFFDLSKNLIEVSQADSIMSANSCIYFVNNGELVEASFERFGNLIYRNKVVSGVSPSYKIYPGVVVQDDFMRCHLAIPFSKGLCANVHVMELDGYRIIDAKHEGFTTILIAEKGGDFSRNILSFNKNFSSYEFWKEQINSPISVNFVALENGLVIMADDEQVTVFKDKFTKKEIKNAPVDSSTRLCHHGMEVYFVDGTKFYRLKMS
jgi:hypothetical protein